MARQINHTSSKNIAVGRFVWERKCPHRRCRVIAAATEKRGYFEVQVVETRETMVLSTHALLKKPPEKKKERSDVGPLKGFQNKCNAVISRLTPRKKSKHPQQSNSDHSSIETSEGHNAPEDNSSSFAASDATPKGSNPTLPAALLTPCVNPEWSSPENTPRSRNGRDEVDGDDISIPSLMDRVTQDDNSDDSSVDPDSDLEEDDLTPFDFIDSDEEGFTCNEGSEVFDEDDERRATRQQNYERTKAKMIEEGHTIRKVMKNGSAIDIGVRVKTRRVIGQRYGVVVEKVQVTENNSKKNSWGVQFDGSNDVEIMKPGTLMRADTVSSKDEVFEWKVVEAHHAVDEPVEYANCGVLGFNFGKFDENLKNPEDNEDYGFPFFELLERLWPGSWKRQLQNLNGFLKAHNSNATTPTCRHVKEVSQEEWWAFIGIILYAAVAGEGGVEKLFRNNNDDDELPSLFKRPEITCMTRGRFEKIKTWFPCAFYGDESSDDPWYKINGFVEGFNKNRHYTIAASVRKIFDELMSPLQPRSTPTGGLPHYSFIKRKPRPHGTEFKVVCCAATGKLYVCV